MYIELRTSDTLHKKTAGRLLPGSRTTVIGAGQSEGPDAWCDVGAARPKIRCGTDPRGEKDPFPILRTLYAKRGLVRIGLKDSKSTVPHQ
jgi:hypothetical protein